MAYVSIQREWPDGDKLDVTADAGTGYPQAMAEAARTALDAFAEACGVVLSPEEGP